MARDVRPDFTHIWKGSFDRRQEERGQISSDIWKFGRLCQNQERRSDMFRVFQEEKLITICMFAFLGSSILLRVFLGLLYRNMIKEADNMASTRNRLLKQCKTKFASCYQLGNGVANIPVFVDKFLNRMTLGPLSFETIYHLSGQLMLLSVVFSGVGVCKSIIGGRTVGEVLPFYIVSFFGLYFYFSISTVVDVRGKRRVLKINLVDYLENHLSPRIDVTRQDMEMLYGESAFEEKRRPYERIQGGRSGGRKGRKAGRGIPAKPERRTVELMPFDSRIAVGGEILSEESMSGQGYAALQQTPQSAEVLRTGQARPEGRGNRPERVWQEGQVSGNVSGEMSRSEQETVSSWAVESDRQETSRGKEFRSSEENREEKSWGTGFHEEDSRRSTRAYREEECQGTGVHPEEELRDMGMTGAEEKDLGDTGRHGAGSQEDTGTSWTEGRERQGMEGYRAEDVRGTGNSRAEGQERQGMEGYQGEDVRGTESSWAEGRDRQTGGTIRRTGQGEGQEEQEAWQQSSGMAPGQPLTSGFRPSGDSPEDSAAVTEEELEALLKEFLTT